MTRKLQGRTPVRDRERLARSQDLRDALHRTLDCTPPHGSAAERGTRTEQRLTLHVAARFVRACEGLNVQRACPRGVWNPATARADGSGGSGAVEQDVARRRRRDGGVGPACGALRIAGVPGTVAATHHLATNGAPLGCTTHLLAIVGLRNSGASRFVRFKEGMETAREVAKRAQKDERARSCMAMVGGGRRERQGRSRFCTLVCRRALSDVVRGACIVRLRYGQ